MPSTPYIAESRHVSTRQPRTVVPAEELGRLRERFPNVLLVGPQAAVDAAIGQVCELVRAPIRSFQADGRTPLPLSPDHGTLVIRDVSALPLAEQHRLSQWLARTAGVSQVVATSAEPLLPLVEQGTFLEVLYYRLNLAYYEVGAS